ncbi:MAG: T9SS type A sorting domain-containing protein [Bacteroidota bacterium]
MKKTAFLLSMISILINSLSVSAATRYYRLSYRDDPSTTIVIGWDQNGGSNPMVYYDIIDHGTDFSAYAFNHGVDRTINTQGMNNNYSRISGLTPNTVYYFIIKDSDGTSARMSFKTIPDDPNIPISFLSGGDSRTGVPIIEPGSWRPVRQKANTMVGKLLPGFIAFSGDMILESSVGGSTLWPEWFTDWQLTISSVEGRMTPITVVYGNHEMNTDLNNLFDIPTTENYYALNFGGNLLRLYSLNSTDDVCTSTTQLNWFTDDLQTHTGTSAEPYWKAVQYHIPMVPHGEYSDRSDMINCWANLFQPNKVRLAMEGHTHVVKTTWPIVPSFDVGSEKGFIRDDANGTVFVGEGTWGAPLRDLYAPNIWTRDQAKINAFMLVCVSKEKMNIYTIQYENVASVGQIQPSDTCCTLPTGISLWSPANGSVVTLTNNTTHIESIDHAIKYTKVYPNPAKTEINISFNADLEASNVEILSSRGIPVKQYNIVAKKDKAITLNISDIAKGVYFVYIRSGKHVESHKIIID